jgi:hypothetical protein
VLEVVQEMSGTADEGSMSKRELSSGNQNVEHCGGWTQYATDQHDKDATSTPPITTSARGWLKHYMKYYLHSVSTAP